MIYEAEDSIVAPLREAMGKILAESEARLMIYESDDSIIYDLQEEISRVMSENMVLKQKIDFLEDVIVGEQKRTAIMQRDGARQRHYFAARILDLESEIAAANALLYDRGREEDVSQRESSEPVVFSVNG